MAKVALVTGGASGIGRAACLKFAELGIAVVVADVDEAGGKRTAEEVSGETLLLSRCLWTQQFTSSAVCPLTQVLYLALVVLKVLPTGGSSVESVHLWQCPFPSITALKPLCLADALLRAACFGREVPVCTVANSTNCACPC